LRIHLRIYLFVTALVLVLALKGELEKELS